MSRTQDHKIVEVLKNLIKMDALLFEKSTTFSALSFVFSLAGPRGARYCSETRLEIWTELSENISVVAVVGRPRC